jgi:hypothetical protein
MLRFLKISLALAGFAALAAAPAGAAVKFGSSMLGPPNNATCIAPMGGSFNCTMVLAALPPANQEPAGMTAPSNGVIVAWTLRSGNSPVEHKVRLRVLRANTGVASGPVETLPLNGGFNNFIARIPVKVGDRIGVDAVGVSELQAVPIVRNLSSADFDFWAPPLADGEDRAPSAAANDIELLLNATLEPDADGDGWGDETQDKCVGAAGPNEGCPPPKQETPLGPPIPTEAVPDTKIGKVTIIAAKKKVTFRFRATVSGATFNCKLDKKPWKPCKSPKSYSGLKEGRHSFRVKAVGPTAVPDPTPAKRSFKVEL